MTFRESVSQGYIFSVWNVSAFSIQHCWRKKVRCGAINESPRDGYCEGSILSPTFIDDAEKLDYTPDGVIKE